jgi:NADPH:quinone reductase-like Zn-dependent oxidoreductase
MVAVKPGSLSFVEAASVPVVAVTAYQMLFDHARMKAGQSVLIHGAAGNVGAYAVQLAKQAELQVFAVAGPGDLDYVRGLGAEMVVNYKTTKFEDVVPPVDAALDMVGGETQHRSFRVLKPDGILVSVISPPPQRAGFRSEFLLAEVTTARLDTLTRLFDIHTPFAFRPGDEQDPRDEHGEPIYDSGVTLIETWRAMEALVDGGRCRSIGLSDVTLKRLKEVVAVARIKPAAVQVESHPYLPEWDLLDFCREHGIIVQAFAPLGHAMAPRVLDDPVITE